MKSSKEAAETSRPSSFDKIKQGAHDWIFSKAPTWLLSTVVHAIVLILIALIPFAPPKRHSEAPTFEAADAVDAEPPEITRFEVGETPLDPTELNTETLTLEAQPLAQTAEYNDDSPVFQEAGGGIATGTAEGAGLGFDVKATGLGP